MSDREISSPGERAPGRSGADGVRRDSADGAPADIRKEGSAYDLPLALCILTASGQINADALQSYVIMGELSLDGILRPIKGVLPIAMQAKKEKFKG